MRIVVAVVLFLAALLAIAASMGMNWTFWTAQGANAEMSRVLGAVSITVDIFKAALPMVIAWAWAERLRLGTTIAVLLLCACLTFSFVSALGFASWSRGVSTGSRESLTLRYEMASRELGDINKSLSMLAASRPAAVIRAAIERAKQDKRWSSSHECNEATTNLSRSFCANLGDLRVELASSLDREKLETRRAELNANVDALVRAGAGLDSDLQAGILSKLFGLQLARIQNGLVVLVALVVELSAAFGLYLALLPLRTTRGNVAKATLLNRNDGIKRLVSAQLASKPTRLVRRSDGQLMIE